MIMSEKQEPKEYWGSHEIEYVEGLARETELGSKVLKLHLKNKHHPYDIVTERSYNLFKRDEPMDDTTFKEMRYRAIIPVILAQLLEYHVYDSEVPNMLQHVVNSYELTTKRATNFLWTEDDNSFEPGAVNAEFWRTPLEVDNVLKSIPEPDTEVEEEEDNEDEQPSEDHV